MVRKLVPERTPVTRSSSSEPEEGTGRVHGESPVQAPKLWSTSGTTPAETNVNIKPDPTSHLIGPRLTRSSFLLLLCGVQAIPNAMPCHARAKANKRRLQEVAGMSCVVCRMLARTRKGCATSALGLPYKPRRDNSYSTRRLALHMGRGVPLSRSLSTKHIGTASSNERQEG